MSMPIRLCVGIVTYNNSNDQLAAALSSLSKSLDIARHYHEVESTILIAHNGSRCNEELMQLHCASHRLVQLPPTGNIGFAAAMNELMRVAFGPLGAEFFVMLNPDTFTHPDAMCNLLSSAVCNENSVIEGQQFPDEHPKTYSPETGETDWASGACMMLPKRVYAATEGLDTNFFMYMEDVDFSWRARSIGAKILHCGGALIGHQTADREYSPSADRAMFESGLYLACKWQNNEFQQWCADELRNRLGFSHVQVQSMELANKNRCQLLPIKWRATASFTATFNKYFSFAHTRW
jgi:N-acetylglucosaminyl-diphospho-decaprenol L-rhamnosyltransferase